MLFGGRTGERLEPVREVGGTPVDCPLFHGMCDFVRDARVKRCALVDGGEQFLADVLGQIGAHGLCVKDVLAVKVETCGCGGHVCVRGFARDFLDGLQPVFVAHCESPSLKFFRRPYCKMRAKSENGEIVYFCRKLDRLQKMSAFQKLKNQSYCYGKCKIGADQRFTEQCSLFFFCVYFEYLTAL